MTALAGGITMTALAYVIAVLVIVVLFKAFMVVYDWGYNDRIRDELEDG